MDLLSDRPRTKLQSQTDVFHMFMYIMISFYSYVNAIEILAAFTTPRLYRGPPHFSTDTEQKNSFCIIVKAAVQTPDCLHFASSGKAISLYQVRSAQKES
ncbi:hypothetical protein CEXT_245681 [Caerostris extrusa]|uniref:Uncharacterized protein n=1 Tax=Caerostris extrusa TaxID=172846 RepID=A0AAV4N6R8_CAEEX|nr:hypothetical protein CEXT_245681 [Caerostris extrusa]